MGLSMWRLKLKVCGSNYNTSPFSLTRNGKWRLLLLSFHKNVHLVLSVWPLRVSKNLCGASFLLLLPNFSSTVGRSPCLLDLKYFDVLCHHSHLAQGLDGVSGPNPVFFQGGRYHPCSEGAGIGWCFLFICLKIDFLVGNEWKNLFLKRSK